MAAKASAAALMVDRSLRSRGRKCSVPEELAAAAADWIEVMADWALDSVRQARWTVAFAV